MEGKQPRVANAMDTHHEAGAPAPGPPSGSWKKGERERGEKKNKTKTNKVLLTLKKGIIYNPFAQVLGIGVSNPFCLISC